MLDLTQGDLFRDRYRVESVLGRGGYAVVYRATDIQLGRTVAIKVLSPRGGAKTDRVAERFAREARILAGLSDPHTITLFEYGQATPTDYYMIFEFVDGTELGEFVRLHGPVSESVTVYILRQLLQSLAEAHGRGILHRDIKPANVLVFPYADDPHRVKLLDFGIAKPTEKLAEDDYTLTQTGMTMGTPGYMAPEQIRGKQLYPATDLYSVGLLAYHMLTGRSPSTAKNAMDMMKEQLRRESVPLPDDVDAGPELRSVVANLTQKDPSDRFQTAAEVLAKLSGGEVSHPPGSRADDIRAPAPAGVERRESGPMPAPVRTPSTSAETMRSGPNSAASSAALNIVLLVLGVLIVGGIGAAIASRSDDAPQPPAVTPPPPPIVVEPAEPLVRPAAPAAAEPRETEVEIIAPEEEEEVGPCATSNSPQTGASRHSAILGEKARTWRTYVPSTYAPGKPHPVVFAIDSTPNTGDAVYREFARIADEHEFVIIAPESFDPMATWYDETDLDLVREALRKTNEELCIDPRRVYGVGKDGGARFVVSRLVCAFPMTAIATGPIPIEEVSLCDLRTRVPYMHIVGKSDPYMPQEGGVGCNGKERRTLREREAFWKDLHGCKGAPRNYSQSDQGVCRRWSCDDGSFVSCQVSGGRDWPLDNNIFQFPSCRSPRTNYPYGQEIWKFFAAHRRDDTD